MGLLGDIEELLVGDYDDLGLMGGAIAGGGKSPKPKKFRAGSRATERRLNKITTKYKAPSQSLFNPITGKANVSVTAPNASIRALPVAPPISKTVAPQSPTAIGTTAAGFPAVTVTHPITAQPVTAAVAKTASGGVAAIVPHPTTGAPIAIPLLKAKMTTRGMLGAAGLDAMKSLATGSAPSPAPTNATGGGVDADGNPTQGTDAFGVPAGWQPQNSAWLSGDLWAGNPRAWTFGGQRAQFRIAYPAVDLSAMLNWSQLQEYGRVDPYNRTYDNPPSQGRDPFADQYNLDDLRWDLHPPTQSVIGIARIPTNLLLAGSTDVASWKGVVYGSPDTGSDQGLNVNIAVGHGPIVDYIGVDLARLKSDQFNSGSLYDAIWLGFDPINAGSISFVRVPADYWKLDLSDGVPDWYHPGLPVPVDLLSWYAAKMVPDQAGGVDPDKFWADFRTVYPYQFGLTSGVLPNLGREDDGTSDSEHGGRGSLTVYTDPADFPSHTAGMITGPLSQPAPASAAPAPVSSDPNIDPTTGLPFSDGGPTPDASGMPAPDQQYDPNTGIPYTPSYDSYDPASSGMVDTGSDIGLPTDAVIGPSPDQGISLPSTDQIDFSESSDAYAAGPEDDFGYEYVQEDPREGMMPYGTEGDDFEVMPDDEKDPSYFEEETLEPDFGVNDQGEDDGTGF